MAKRKSVKSLINKTAQKIAKRTRAVKVSKSANLPIFDLGYSQSREFSQHRNGHHVIYKALHALNVLHGRPIAWHEVAELLAASPRCGGYAFFIKDATIKEYMFKNRFSLWRKLDRVQQVDRGRSRALFVATGLTTTGEKRADRERHRAAKIQAVMVW